MAAFAPLNQIVWRDYTSITGGLEETVPNIKLKNDPDLVSVGQQHASTAAAAATANIAKEERKGAARILIPSREMQGNRKKNMSVPSACPIINTDTSQQRFHV